MAKPTTPIEVWARDTLDLPVTGEVNKQRPIDDLWSKGYDRGQKPACEEFNYVVNMLTAWLKYIQSEGLPSYLPINGTRITFSGDLSGTASFTGSSQISANVQVVDNSHNHVSANITDATSQPTPNTIVKRDGGGTIAAGDIISRSSTSTDTPTFFWQNFSGQNIADATCQLSGALDIRRLNPSNNGIYSSLSLGIDGVVSMTLPRSNSGQEGQPNSLLRYDYFVNNLNNTATNLTNSFNAGINNTNNNVNNVNNDLQNYKSGAYNTFVAGIRQSSEIAIGSDNFSGYSNGRRASVPAGAYITALADVQTGKPYLEDIDAIWYKYLQYAIGGNWYNIGSL